MGDSTKTTIFLTPEDAVLFIAFQKRFAFIKLLEETGALDLRNGSLELHFDHTGAISSVDIHRHLRVG